MFLAIVFLIALAAPAWAAPDAEIVPRTFPPPTRTDWKPVGCRSVSFEHPVVPPRTEFRRAHGDLESSNEVELAYPPVLAREWTAEPLLYQVTTPSFDAAGNVYMTPLLPHEPILLLSLDGATGARRFMVPLEPGERGGGAAPMVLRDPESGGDVIYVNAYSRLVAMRTDGTVVWDVPTGLGPSTDADQSPIGLNWVANADAIVALTRDGFVLLHDRRTGTALVAPLQLPGERTPPRPSTAPPALAAQVDDLLAPLVTFAEGRGTLDLINVLLGGDAEIANNLSVDARTGRLWIAATAPDDADGRTDGVSEIGALYRLDVVPGTDGGWRLAQSCRTDFAGGSASTPTLGQDGTRVYLGDDIGSLIAVNAADCSEAWTVALGAKIFGSVAASSDGRELYASSATGIYQVFDDGDHGRRGWTAALDVYDIPPSLSGYAGINLLLVGVGANGLLIQAGAGLLTDAQALPVRTGIAHVDRRTGEPRWFADGLEESLAAMSTGPDGSLYLSHSPLRRAFAFALGLTTQPLVGGISKWSATRHDLLARDAACAAADRAENALAFAAECPDSAAADAHQIDELRTQMLAAGARAVADAEIDATTGGRLRQLAAGLEPSPDGQDAVAVVDYLARAGDQLQAACKLLAASGNGAADDCARSLAGRASASGGDARAAVDRCRASRHLLPRR